MSGSLGVEGVAWLVRHYPGLEESSGEAQVAQQVKKLVTAAFVAETQGKIAQIPFGGNRQEGLSKPSGKSSKSFFRDRLLNHDYRVLHISTLDKA